MTGGLVLAAGAARRFGSPKQLAQLDGRPLLQYAIDAMVGVDELDRVVVVLGHAAPQVRQAVDVHTATVVECGRWREGVAASLHCGIAALAGCDRVVVTLGDQPGMTPEAIRAVLAACEGGVPAARAVVDGTPTHPVVFGREIIERIDELHGDVGLRDLLARVPTRDVDTGGLMRAEDVDTPEDLEALRAHDDHAGR